MLDVSSFGPIGMVTGNARFTRRARLPWQIMEWGCGSYGVY